MINPTTIKIALIAIALAVLGAVCFHLGSTLKQAEWDRYKLKFNEESFKTLEADLKTSRETEKRLTGDVATADAALVQSKKEIKNAKSNAITAAHSSGLFIDAKCEDSAGSVPRAADSTSASDGETRARLSDQAAEALISLTSEADEVVRQLQACQQILEAERK